MVATVPELALISPLAVTAPEVVMSPVEPVIEKLLAATSFAPKLNALTISESDKSIPLVIPPAADCTFIPAATASLVSKLLTETNWEGALLLEPFAKANELYAPDPAAVVTVKLESVAVSARVKAISRASVVVIVLPPLYAVCRVDEADEHLVTLFDPSIQSVVPVAVVKPVKLKKESASVLMVTPLVLFGEKVD